MKMDIKFSIKHLPTKFRNTLKISYSETKLISFQDMKSMDISI